jgi:hypothetical protein
MTPLSEPPSKSEATGHWQQAAGSRLRLLYLTDGAVVGLVEAPQAERRLERGGDLVLRHEIAVLRRQVARRERTGPSGHCRPLLRGCCPSGFGSIGS